jgi:hypothetical protein
LLASTLLTGSSSWYRKHFLCLFEKRERKEREEREREGREREREEIEERDRVKSLFPFSLFFWYSLLLVWCGQVTVSLWWYTVS